MTLAKIGVKALLPFIHAGFNMILCHIRRPPRDASRKLDGHGTGRVHGTTAPGPGFCICGLHLAKKCTRTTSPALPAETHEAEVFQFVRLGLGCANALPAKAGILNDSSKLQTRPPIRACQLSPSLLQHPFDGLPESCFLCLLLPCRVPSSVRRNLSLAQLPTLLVYP